MADLSGRLQAVNHEVLTVLGRYEQALELLDRWVTEHPDDEHLARLTQTRLNHWRTDAG